MFTAGATLSTDECKLPTLPDKPVLQDPNAALFPNFFRCAAAGGAANASFVRSLAHENGHALSLQHPEDRVPAQAADQRLMAQSKDTAGCMITAAEGAQAKREAEKKLSAAKPKKKCGASLPEPKPRTRLAVNDLGTLNDLSIGISEAIAVRQPDAALGLEMDLAGPVPLDSQSRQYLFAVDADNNPLTGGTPFPVFRELKSSRRLP